jgi:hypothetical protein
LNGSLDAARANEAALKAEHRIGMLNSNRGRFEAGWANDEFVRSKPVLELMHLHVTAAPM